MAQPRELYTDPPHPGTFLTVEVTKVSIGKDGKVYVTITSDWAENRPTFIWKQAK